MFGDGIAQIASERHHKMPGDTRQNGIAERRGENFAVVNHKNILAAPFADITVGVQHDAFHITVTFGFHHHQLRVDIVAADFRHSGMGVGRHTPPTAHTHIHTDFNGFGSEICTPFPRGDDGFDGAGGRVDTQRFVPAENQWANVAGFVPVAFDGCHNCIGDFLLGIRNFHTDNFRGVEQPFDMRRQPQHGGSLFGVVRADTFKNAAAVMQHMCQHMHLRFIPGDKFTVEPDYVCFWNSHHCLLNFFVSFGYYFRIFLWILHKMCVYCIQKLAKCKLLINKNPPSHRDEGFSAVPPSLATYKKGGAEGIRTPDLLNAIQALSQLSYSPINMLPTSSPITGANR